MLSWLIEASVHRRVAAVFVTAVVAIFGIRAYLETPIEAFPDVTNAQVTVITQMAGAAPEEIERQVTVPLERALNGTPGASQMRSESLFGLSLITLIFEDRVDAFSSRLLVAQRMTSADLPNGVIPTLNPETTPLGEIYQFRMVSDRHDLYELRAELQWNVTRVLKQVQGVGDVVSFGGFLKEVHVQADPARLYAAGVTLADLTTAISRANVNVGGGFLRHGDQELTVRGVGYIESAEDVKRIMLKSKDGTAISVGDVAQLVISPTPRRGSVGYNEQKEAIEGFVLMRRGQNPSIVLHGIHEKVRTLNESILPKGMRVEMFFDRTTLVEHTLSTVHTNLFHGFILVVGVVWLFLRSAVGSAIVAVVIPLSLLVAFLGLYALGLPANLISMGAIDFGILVDGAVVLAEHVIHSMRHDPPADQKALLRQVVRSALDVGRPTFYAMLIIIAALVPVFTLQSVEGRIFRPLALTYAFALLGALVFSITLVPALCALFFKSHHAKIQEPRWQESLRAAYQRTLTRILSRRPVMLVAAAALLAMGALCVTRLGTEFLPELDEGDILIFVEMPASVALEKAQEILVDVRKRILTFPEVTQVLSENGRPEDGTDNEGVNMSETFVRLKPRDEWRKGLDKDGLIQAMRSKLTEIPGVRFNFSQPIKDNVEEAVAGVRGKVVLKVFGPDLTVMRGVLEQVKASLKPVAGITDLDLYRDVSVPQLRIQLDRAAMARAGLSVEETQQTIETALAGRVATSFWEKERPVPVRVLLQRPARDEPEKIADLQIVTPGGARIPLKQVAKIEVVQGLSNITREGNSRYLALKFNVEGRDMGSVVRDAIATVEAHVKPPEGHYFVWGGEFENQARAMARLKLIVPVAVLLVLGLLYGAMSSGRSALAILATVPFALTGGAFALYIADVPLSVSAAVGFIALLGQVSLMGVLVLSAAETRRRAGQPLGEALAEGAAERLRAVLMASLLALCGLLPMALSTGVGSETQRPFALVVVGGMITTLVVALFILPVLYSFITPRKLVTPEEADT
ncbi:MAG TPA: CusA/CzcA family heavy metal efflux RND transporter [Burkholderiales bacterium]|nr:CusA/CzcA family heavy metal efflux RND transporter [Burkholderiales bacterium]